MYNITETQQNYKLLHNKPSVGLNSVTVKEAKYLHE